MLLIDRERVAAQASRGNAGAYAFSDILPLASPGILRKAPRWLLDPLGPAGDPRRATCRASRPGCVASGARASPTACAPSTAAQAALMGLSAAETPLLLAAAGASHMLRSDGVLHLYESEAELARVAARLAGARRPRHRVHAPARRRGHRRAAAGLEPCARGGHLRARLA